MPSSTRRPAPRAGTFRASTRGVPSPRRSEIGCPWHSAEEKNKPSRTFGHSRPPCSTARRRRDSLREEGFFPLVVNPLPHGLWRGPPPIQFGGCIDLEDDDRTVRSDQGSDQLI